MRMEAGMCGVDFTEARPGPGGMPDSFQLIASIGAAAGVGNTGANCQGDFLRIQNTNTVNTALAIPAVVADALKRYCGFVLTNINGQTTPGVVSTNVTPFRIGVFSDNVANAVLDGFDLTYRQTPCN